jgi:hypothetical protein
MFLVLFSRLLIRVCFGATSRWQINIQRRSISAIAVPMFNQDKTGMAVSLVRFFKLWAAWINLPGQLGLGHTIPSKAYAIM